MANNKCNRRKFLKNLSIGVASSPFLLNAFSCSKSEKKKQNIVFFLVDDLGWKDLGYLGSSFYETPNIDRLASESMIFTSAYAACPVCSPTRASIMTGKYPARMNTTDYFGARQPDQIKNSKRWPKDRPLLPAPYEDRLPHEEVTVAETLKENDYATFFAGKWHLGPEGFWPEDQGFDANQGGIERGGPYGGKKYFSPYGNPRLTDGPEGEHLPDRLATEAVKFMKAHVDQPFLTYLSFYSVHTPLMAREDLQDKYEKKRKTAPEEAWGKEGKRKVRQVQNHAVYAGMVEAVDQAVGKVLNTLEETGLDKNTIIFLMSDNGGLSTSEGHPTSNLPLRAGKGWLYEGGIREPMLIKWPGIADQGKKCDTPIISNDFYPTILDMVGIPLKSKQHQDGVSLVPLLEEKSLKNRPLFWHYPHYGNQGGSPGGAVREGDYKLIEFYEDNHLELYNIKEDIGEKNNLVEQKSEKVKKLHQKLVDWRKSVDARMPTHLPKVLIIGDSISIGYLPHVQEEFKSKYFVVHNPGNAQHTGTGLEKIHDWLGEQKWDIIHFNWGLWDLCYRHPDSKVVGQRDKVNGSVTYTLEDYEKNLESLVQILKKTSAKLVFAATTYVPEGEAGRFVGDDIKYNNAAKKVMNKYDIQINDLHQTSVNVHTKHATAENNVHFTKEGYKKLSENVVAAIEKAFTN